MNGPEQDRKCRGCKRTLSVDNFRSRTASKKPRWKCRDCRTGKPYNRSNDQPATTEGSSTPPKSSVRRTTPPSQTSKQGGSSATKPGEFGDGPKRNGRAAAQPINTCSDAKASPIPAAPAIKSLALKVIDAIVSSVKIYQHQAPPGLAFSGPMDKTKNIQTQRRFLVPPGVIRDKHSDFPPLDKELEKGMVSRSPGCLECSLKNIHCTYGAGVHLNGKSRDPMTGKCDYCTFTTRKCRGNGYEGYSKDQVGAHTELVDALDLLSARIDTCIRAGDRDKSAAVNAKKLIKKAGEVREKLATLSAQLSKPKPRTTSAAAGTVPGAAIVID